MEKSNLSDAEFKALVIRMINAFSENLNCIKKGLVKNEGYCPGWCGSVD